MKLLALIKCICVTTQLLCMLYTIFRTVFAMCPLYIVYLMLTCTVGLVVFVYYNNVIKCDPLRTGEVDDPNAVSVIMIGYRNPVWCNI